MNRARRIFSILTKGLVTLVCALVVAAMPACGSSGGSQGDGSASAGKAEALSLPFSAGGDEVSGASYTQPEGVVEPVLGVATGGEPAVSAEHVQHGYVVAQASSAARLKFQVTQGEQTYNYDLPNDGTQTVYPLNMGDGFYTFRIMQNTSGNNYVELYATDADVMLESEFAPYLIANLYCDYSASSECTDKARELTSSATNVAEVVKVVCEFVAASVTYDNDKARELAEKSGYVPDPDETLATGRGICFDYASLSAAMLRAMGIPTKVMTGYVGSNEVYHAWISVYIDGTWHSAKFVVDPNTWSRCDVTFASTGATKYVGDASAYTDRYTY